MTENKPEAIHDIETVHGMLTVKQYKAHPDCFGRFVSVSSGALSVRGKYIEVRSRDEGDAVKPLYFVWLFNVHGTALTHVRVPESEVDALRQKIDTAEDYGDTREWGD